MYKNTKDPDKIRAESDFSEACIKCLEVIAINFVPQVMSALTLGLYK